MVEVYYVEKNPEEVLITPSVGDHVELEFHEGVKDVWSNFGKVTQVNHDNIVVAQIANHAGETLERTILAENDPEVARVRIDQFASDQEGDE